MRLLIIFILIASNPLEAFIPPEQTSLIDHLYDERAKDLSSGGIGERLVSINERMSALEEWNEQEKKFFLQEKPLVEKAIASLTRDSSNVNPYTDRAWFSKTHTAMVKRCCAFRAGRIKIGDNPGEKRRKKKDLRRAEKGQAAKAGAGQGKVQGQGGGRGGGQGGRRNRP